MKMFIGFYNRSVWMTYLGVAFAITGIYMSIQGDFDNAMAFLILAGLCDLFDGAIARKTKRSTEAQNFGVQIDSLADVVNFLVLPAVFFMTSHYYKKEFFIIAIFYVIAGIIRLAYFNINVENAPRKTYTGLPVTSAAAIIPLSYLIFDNIIVLYMYLLIGILFITNFRFKKPGLLFSLISFILALIACVYLLVVK